MNSNVYDYINVLNSAENGTYVRHEVILNNLANVSTPEFKRSDIKFEDYLKNELVSTKGNMDQKVANVNLGKLKTSVYVDEAELSYRLDGNNVDIDMEEAHLAENQMRYYTLKQYNVYKFLTKNALQIDIGGVKIKGGLSYCLKTAEKGGEFQK